MFCEKCGGRCEADERFCAHCGAPLEAGTPRLDTSVFGASPAAVPAAPKRAVRVRAAWLIGVGAVVLAVAAALVLALGGRGAPDYVTLGDGVLLPVQSQSEGMYRYIADGEMIPGGVESVNALSYSLDRSVYAVTDMDEDLYVITAQGAEKVAEEVTAFSLSAMGTGLAYTDREGGIYLYHIPKGAGEQIDGGVNLHTDAITPIAVSPDGRSVAYIVDDGGDNTLRLVSGGRAPVDIRKYATPLGLSDGGGLYFEYKDGLYYYNGREDSKLDADTGFVLFNADQTEAAYPGKDEQLHISVHGGTPIPTGIYGVRAVPMPTGGLAISGTAIGVRTFKGFSFLTEKGAYRITDSFGSVKFAGPGDQYILSSDGKKCIYLRNGDLYLVEDTRRDDQPRQITSGAKVTFFETDGDCASVQYQDGSGAFSYQKMGEDAVWITSDTRSATMVQDGAIIYFTGDGVLYRSVKGGTPTATDGVGEVSNIYGLGMDYVVTEDSAGTLCYYRTDSNGDLTLIYRDEM